MQLNKEGGRANHLVKTLLSTRLCAGGGTRDPAVTETSSEPAQWEDTDLFPRSNSTEWWAGVGEAKELRDPRGVGWKVGERFLEEGKSELKPNRERAGIEGQH